MRRIVAAVVEISRGQTHGIPIVVSHGRILSVLESYLRGRRLSVGEWQQIPMPGITLIDPAVPAILEPWKAIPEA